MQSNNIVRGDFINASFQGHYDLQLLEEDPVLTGTGVVMDDELNIFIGKWQEQQMMGKGIIRLASGTILYGQFNHNQIKGNIGVKMGKHQLFIHRLPSKNNSQQLWRKEAVLIDTDMLLFYVLELTPKEQKIGGDLDITQKIGIMGADSIARQAKVGWKVKIVERCGLTSEGRLSGYSKYIKNRSTNQNRSSAEDLYNRRDFSIFEQNIISLISTFLGGIGDVSYVTPATFVRSMPEEHKDLDAKIMQNDCYWLRSRDVPLNSNSLGMVISPQSRIYSFGNFNRQGKLNGLGVQYSKRGEAYTGIFKGDLLTKEYSHTPPSEALSSTFQLRQLLTNQHLKSIHYVNNGFYMSTLPPLVHLSKKIVKYALAFEKQFEKRHFSYQDSEGYNENSTEQHNFMKYVTEEPLERMITPKNFRILEDQERRKIQTSNRAGKIAGFIVSRSSKSKSPPSNRGQSPSPNSSARKVGMIRSSRHSPFKTHIHL